MQAGIGTAGELTRALGRDRSQFELVVDVLKTIFDGNSGHDDTLATRVANRAV
jgi:hypothetical protein